MTLASLWRLLAVALPVLGTLMANLQSVDLTYHLRAGHEILATRSIPSADSWTFTVHGAPWVDQQWGAQVLLALIERLGGWAGLVIVRALVVGFIFGSLAVIARRRGLSERTTTLLVLPAFIVAAPALALRPQLFGMACFVVVLLLVADRRQHPGRLWAIPILVAIWANLHGSFFLGPVVLGLAWLEDLHDQTPAPHRSLLIAMVAVLTAFVTPFGPLVWVYSLALSTNPEVTSRISEWQPASLRDISGALFFASAGGVVVVLARRSRQTSWPTLLWLLVFFVLGAYAIRGVAWWPLAAFVALSGLIASPAVEPVEPVERAEPAVMQRLNLGVAGVLVAAAILVLPIWRPIDSGLKAPLGVVGNAPPGITAALRDLVRPGTRIFHPQPWGSWFEYALPDAFVAVDSRIELFPPELWDQYDDIVQGRDDWQRHLDDWSVTIFVAAPEWTEAIGTLAREGWSIRHSDMDGTVLVRD